jgi:hypothetical protein
MYRNNSTKKRLSIWVYEDDGKTFVCNVVVEKLASGVNSVNVRRASDVHEV